MPALRDEDELTTTVTSEQSDDTPDRPLSDEDAGGAATAESDPYEDGLDDDLDAEPSEETGESDEAQGAAEDGRPRNPDGTFAPKGAAPPTEGDGQRGGAAQPVPEAAGAIPDPGPAPTPWVANLYGQDAEPIPGALYKPGHGVFVPETQLGALTALVARGSKYEEFRRERQEAARQVEQAVAPVEFEAKTLAGIVAQFLQPTFYEQFGLTPDLAQPYIQELQFRLREAALERREKFGTAQAIRQTTGPVQAELDPYDAQATVRAEVAEVVRQADYHGLFSDADVQALGSRLTALNPFVQDESGNWYLDRQVVTEAIALAAEPKRAFVRERQAQQAKQQASTAADRNRRVTGTATPAKLKPTAPAKPDTFSGDPWDNPALSKEERRALWLKAHG